MKPILPLGGISWLIQAWAQAIAAASMHMGSGPGVAGLSGMQVKPLPPSRRVRILPSAPMATMVAPAPTLTGAAAMALAIIASSVMAGIPTFSSA
ncbi:hypothetical protein D3C76_1599200 [compost metagenome]